MAKVPYSIRLNVFTPNDLKLNPKPSTETGPLHSRRRPAGWHLRANPRRQQHESWLAPSPADEQTGSGIVSTSHFFGEAITLPITPDS